MYAYFTANGISNRLGDLPEIFTAVPAYSVIQVASDIGGYEISFHEDVDVITLLYAERSRIIDPQSVFIFASHDNTSFDGALHGDIISHRIRKIHGYDNGLDVEQPRLKDRFFRNRPAFPLPFTPSLVT